jgi:uncharacterized protein YfaS (alpha-2-macroglobulin family)
VTLDVATARLAPGGKLRYTVTVRDAAGQPARGQHLLEIEVTDPQGVPRPRYGGARVTRGGVLKVREPLALNAARGRWRIRVTAPQCGAAVKGRWDVL